MRYESLGKEDDCDDLSCILKPFVGTLREVKPVRQSLASNRKQVLRGVRVTGVAKRRQRVPKPCH